MAICRSHSSIYTVKQQQQQGGQEEEQSQRLSNVADPDVQEFTDTERKFQEAAVKLEALVRDGVPLPDQVLLSVYGLYKQGTVGDVRGPQPWATQIKTRAKYDSWAERRGMSQEEAMNGYVSLVNGLGST